MGPTFPNPFSFVFSRENLSLSLLTLYSLNSCSTCRRAQWRVFSTFLFIVNKQQHYLFIIIIYTLSLNYPISHYFNFILSSMAFWSNHHFRYFCFVRLQFFVHFNVLLVFCFWVLIILLSYECFHYWGV